MTKSKRTPVELLLMELIYQTVRTENSSSDSEVEALKRAGFTNEEIVARDSYYEV
jgi:hypothetical protein